MSLTESPRSGDRSAVGVADGELRQWRLRPVSILERHNGTITLLVAGIIFALDRASPLYIVWGPVYVLVVLLSLWSLKPRNVYLAATLCSTLTLADALLSATPFGMGVSMGNRALAISVYWATAIICLWRRQRMLEENRLLLKAERALSDAPGRCRHPQLSPIGMIRPMRVSA